MCKSSQKQILLLAQPVFDRYCLCNLQFTEAIATMRLLRSDFEHFTKVLAILFAFYAEWPNFPFLKKKMACKPVPVLGGLNHRSTVGTFARS